MKMRNERQIARLAGLLYLLMAIIGGFAFFSIQNILVAEDASMTVLNIFNSVITFKLSIIAKIVSNILFILLVLVLHRLLNKVNWFQSALMLILVLISIPLDFVNLIFQLSPLIILDNSIYLEAFDDNQLNSFIVLSLIFLKYGIYVVQIFWGLWLLPLGYLVFKSNILPKTLGILLFLGGMVYFWGSLIFFVNSEGLLAFEYLYLIPAIAEISFCFWLLIKGVERVKY